jgi:hypothetical protein
MTSPQLDLATARPCCRPQHTASVLQSAAALPQHQTAPRAQARASKSPVPWSPALHVKQQSSRLPAAQGPLLSWAWACRRLPWPYSPRLSAQAPTLPHLCPTAAGRSTPRAAAAAVQQQAAPTPPQSCAGHVRGAHLQTLQQVVLPAAATLLLLAARSHTVLPQDQEPAACLAARTADTAGAGAPGLPHVPAAPLCPSSA